MLDWDTFRIVLAIGKEGSLSGAARFLEVNQATVARQLKRAETELGAKLFDRMSNGLFPTDAGLTALQYAQQIEEKVNLASRSIKGTDQAIEGVIRFSVPQNFMEFGLAEHIKEFQALYPQITFDIIATDQVMNFSERGVDVVIRAQNEPPNGLWGYQLTKLNYSFVASESYLQRWQKDIDAHSATAPLPYIALTSSTPERDEMQFLRAFPSAVRVAGCTSMDSIVPLIQAGMGAGRIARLMIPSLEGIKTILDCDEKWCLSLWVLTHRDYRQSKRIRLLMEFLRERFVTTA